MQASGKGFGCKTLLLVIVVALVMGVLGGGAAGGSLAWYMAKSAPAVVAPVALNTTAQPVVAQRQSVTLTADTAIVDAVKKVSPAVVTIVNTLTAQRAPSRFGAPRTQPGQAVGTGVIIDAQGYIVTNNHVIEGAQKIEVLFENGDKAEAKLIGVDTFGDLAIVQVTDKPMPAVAHLGDSSALQVGEPVIAIGSALGDFKNTVTVGVVSGLNRRVDANAASSLEGLIQTDAAINHGNSGGPLLNAAGQVIGINTLVVRSDGGGDVAEGLGFAIPASTVQYVSSQLIGGGKVSRPFLGVTYQMLTPQLAAANDLQAKSGAWIQDVTANGPAAKVGLQKGDVITAINGIALGDNMPLATALLKNKVGQSVALTVARGGQSLTLNVTLGERPTT